MRKSRVQNNVFIVARRSTAGKKLDYYMLLPDKQEIYMFTKNYSAECYETCKAGVPINNILSVRRRNPAVMNLVNYLNYMMPYFIEIFDLKAVTRRGGEQLCKI